MNRKARKRAMGPRGRTSGLLGAFGTREAAEAAAAENRRLLMRAAVTRNLYAATIRLSRVKGERRWIVTVGRVR